jgi:hypothetical protein
MPYLLPRHVYLSITEGGCVLLDVRRDQYIGVTLDQIEHVRTANANGAHRECPICNELVAHGLLTTGAEGKSLEPTVLRAPTVELADPERLPRGKVQGSHVRNFARAYLSAVVSLRLLSFEKMLDRVRRRNDCYRTAMPPVNVERVSDLTGIFRRLTPLFYASRDRCLFDSLVRLNFLALYGLFPNWVFGVRIAPFSAHCWVQLDEFLFDGFASYVHNYTPIMVV